jgi:hypothetical protein
MARMTATETAELVAGLIGDSAYDMINEYDGYEDLAVCVNTQTSENVATITLDNGRVLIVTVTVNDNDYR